MAATRRAGHADRLLITLMLLPAGLAAQEVVKLAPSFLADQNATASARLAAMP